MDVVWALSSVEQFSLRTGVQYEAGSQHQPIGGVRSGLVPPLLTVSIGLHFVRIRPSSYCAHMRQTGNRGSGRARLDDDETAGVWRVGEKRRRRGSNLRLLYRYREARVSLRIELATGCPKCTKAYVLTYLPSTGSWCGIYRAKRARTRWGNVGMPGNA